MWGEGSRRRGDAWGDGQQLLVILNEFKDKAQTGTTNSSSVDHPDFVPAVSRAYREIITLEKELEFQFKLLDEALTKGDN